MAFGTKQTRAGFTVGGGTGGFASATSDNLANTPSQGFTRLIDTTTVGTATVNNKFRDHIFRVGLNYRFAREAVVARY